MYPTIIDLGSISLGPIDIPLAIHSYGLMLAAAFLTVMFVVQRELVRKQLDAQLASSVVFASAVGGIIGAKLYAAFEDGSFSVNELFSTSGLVWYGGMIGGAAAAFFVLYRWLVQRCRCLMHSRPCFYSDMELDASGVFSLGTAITEDRLTCLGRWHSRTARFLSMCRSTQRRFMKRECRSSVLACCGNSANRRR